MLSLLALLSLLAPQDEAARWSFDGDVKDSGPAAIPTKAVGRLEFIDSPVSGRTAVFNGVDACVQVDPPGRLAAGDFSLSAWVLPLDRRPAPIFSRKGWTLHQAEGGALRLNTLKTPAGFLPGGQWTHLVLTVKKKEALLYVNGERFAFGELPDVDFDAAGSPLLIGKSLEDGKHFTGLIDEVRLFGAELGSEAAAKLTDAGMPWIRAKAHAKKPFAGKFELLQDDVVAFLGGENGRVGQDLGYLETLLSLHAAGKRVRFRNMAWEGDTVYEQPRPLNFGSWTDQFRRTGASVVFLQFGQLEALEGKAGLDRFGSAYESLIGKVAETTTRIVLVSPTPFGKGSARQPDLSAKNDDLKLYVEAIRKLAAKTGCLFVDLNTKPLAEEGMTRNGLHLSAEGHWIAARETARQLEVAGLSDLEAPDLKGAFRRESIEKIRQSIRAKNALWNDAWRPTNWAFLNGDRMEQPSSRDHVDRRIRWYPVEVQQLPAMLRRDEDKLEALIQAERK